MLKFRRRQLLLSSLVSLAAIATGQKPNQSAVLDSPVAESTAVSFFWIGDMDSHFRAPINFYAVSQSDRRFHTVSVGPFADHQWNAFISVSEMQRLMDGLKALDLRWVDSKGREAFKDAQKRTGTGFLDITVVSHDGTSKSYIRIARMCEELSQLDSAMPTPRILWQFQLFRVDNGCHVPGYNNSVIPPQ